MFPVATVFPSFVHRYLAVGFPVALQWNVAMAPSMTVILEGTVNNLGASKTDQIKGLVKVRIYTNRPRSYFHASELLLIMNFVITLSK